MAKPLLAECATITSVLVMASASAGNLDIIIIYCAIIAVMFATTIFLIIANLAESYINPRITMVFLQITAFNSA